MSFGRARTATAEDGGATLGLDETANLSVLVGGNQS